MEKNGRAAKLGDVITVADNDGNGNCAIWINGKKIGGQRIGMLMPFQVARNYAPGGCEARFLPLCKFNHLGKSFKILKSL